MKYLIISLLWISTVSNSFSQSFSSLVAFVTDKDSGLPISNASIIVKEAGWSSKTTGSDGKAFFDKSMPIGEIHYIVSKEGYQGVEGTFNITTEEKSNTLNVKLSKFRDDKLLVTGEVVDEDGKDLEGAIVEVRVADIIRTAKTDNSGNYKIELTLNRTQYDVSTLKLEAKCSNGSGKKSETIDLTRRNVIYKDFRINCSQLGPHNKLASFTKDNLIFELLSCTQNGQNIEYKIRLTSIDIDCEVGAGNLGRIITASGNEFPCTESRLGDQVVGTNWISKTLVANVPIICIFKFGKVNENVTSIPKTEIGIAYVGSYFNVEFRNIKL